MKFKLEFSIEALPESMNTRSGILLLGSCFSEHIGARLLKGKFDALQNPHGILFNPASISKAIDDCVQDRTYIASDLFIHEGLWHSWNHHGSFSSADKNATLKKINGTIHAAHDFISRAKWMVM